MKSYDSGKYGLYATIGKNISVKTDKSEDEITLEDVIPFLSAPRQSNSSILKTTMKIYQLERVNGTLCVL